MLLTESFLSLRIPESFSESMKQAVGVKSDQQGRIFFLHLCLSSTNASGFALIQEAMELLLQRLQEEADSFNIFPKFCRELSLPRGLCKEHTTI